MAFKTVASLSWGPFLVVPFCRNTSGTVFSSVWNQFKLWIKEFKVTLLYFFSCNLYKAARWILLGSATVPDRGILHPPGYITNWMLESCDVVRNKSLKGLRQNLSLFHMALVLRVRVQNYSHGSILKLPKTSWFSQTHLYEYFMDWVSMTGTCESPMSRVGKRLWGRRGRGSSVGEGQVLGPQWAQGTGSLGHPSILPAAAAHQCLHQQWRIP